MDVAKDPQALKELEDLGLKVIPVTTISLTPGTKSFGDKVIIGFDRPSLSEALNLGEISGGITSLTARENVAYAASAIMSAAASSANEVDLAAEAAIITKQMMLQKISISLVAQANLSENAKLNLVS